MATATAQRAEEPQTGPVEEHYYRRGDIDFCFLLNRQHHNLRVFDYRVGNYQQKRDFFDRIARAEGLRKVFTVVEKQDSKSWRSVGFSREGAIPGYFRTADAYIMSRVYTDDGDPIQGGAPKLTAPNISASSDSAAKPRGLSFELVKDEKRLASMAESFGERALYAPFRRGMFFPDLGLRGRIGRREVWVGAETDASFGHAKVDILTPPEKDSDVGVIEFCVKTLVDELIKMDTASVFALCAADWPLSSQVYVNLGFKVTSRLTDHIVRDDEYVGVQLYHRRVGSTTGPRLPSFI